MLICIVEGILCRAIALEEWMRLEVAKENPDATLRVPHPRLAGGGEIFREPTLRFRVFPLQ